MGVKQKFYVDKGLVDKDTMLLVRVYYASYVYTEHTFSIDYTDTKTRRLTVTEKIKNALILKLGGRLASKYSKTILNHYE